MMARTRVKICGITRLADALAAVDLGVDALGFVFYPPSPRGITPRAAREIIRHLPPFVATTGLFVNEDAATIAAVVAETGVDVVQFHGAELPRNCASSPRPYIKALQVIPGFDCEAEARRYTGARALLMDTFHPQLAGGSGQRFDWSLLPAARSFPLILAGGLCAENVAEAILTLRPYAVDVSGGVESDKGIKDVAKMRDFIAEVTRVEHHA